MAEFLALIPIAEFKKNDSFEKGQPLPLHCTLIYWFELSPNLTLIGLQDEMQFLARNTQNPLRLVSQAPALFGPDNDVPVHVQSVFPLGFE